MRHMIALTAVAFLATASLPALASNDDVSCGQVTGTKMSLQDVTAKVSGMGYDVRKVKQEEGCY
ncbi:MAG: PepSY domain-containing protein, partial [Alphaproteobacteria bacterium]